MKKVLSILLGMIVGFFFNFAWADTEQDHQALRNLRTQAAEALNANNFAQIEPLLAKNFTLVTVDNHKFTNIQDFKAYWNGLFHDKGAILKNIKVDPQADALTNFLTPDVGIVYGVSDDTYNFTDGDTRQMNTRWTAVVKKEADGWKLVSVHFSSNILDNPVLTAAKKMSYWYATGGLIVGLIIGILGMMLFRRRAYS
jgi:ketosteroid isomerase-like protein